MISIDTNILVYAHRAESPFHDQAKAALLSLNKKNLFWCIPWPCVSEFLAVITNPRIFKTPTPTTIALNTLSFWLQNKNCFLISEGAMEWESVKKQLNSPSIKGGKFHDARIALICMHHGVTELWSVDRDFQNFPWLKVKNPFL